ncbi:MAG: hypothetical protein AAF039_18590, partial [Bacteroidota bacterium]
WKSAVLKVGNVPGCHVKRGNIHFEGREFLVKIFKFTHPRGSSIVVKPEFVKDFIGIDSIFYFNHRLITLDPNIALQKIPFRAGIYKQEIGRIFMCLFKKSKN